MRNRTPVALLALACITASAHAAGILGLWLTPKNHGRVIVEPCGDAVCARIADGDQLRANPAQADVNNPDPAKRTRPVKDLRILDGYRGGPAAWRGGTVYDPQTGDLSNDSTLTLTSQGTLEVEGCRFLLCRSETWRRP
ncbi:MAG: DUF2147 domain-containing protein [Rhizomicrobium sp.]